MRREATEGEWCAEASARPLRLRTGSSSTRMLVCTGYSVTWPLLSSIQAESEPPFASDKSAVLTASCHLLSSARAVCGSAALSLAFLYIRPLGTCVSDSLSNKSTANATSQRTLRAF